MKKFSGLLVGLALVLAPAGLGVGELAVRTLGGVGGGQEVEVEQGDHGQVAMNRGLEQALRQAEAKAKANGGVPPLLP